MRAYDFNLAKKIIDTYCSLGNLHSAYMGMHESWFFTAEKVFEEGKYTKKSLECYKEGDDLRICGIYQSRWATPVISVVFNDGESLTFNCYTGECTMDILDRIAWMNKCLEEEHNSISEMVQKEREDLLIEDFKE
jgi:hypothetical protein